MSTMAKSSKYTYRSSGGGTTDVNIEYSADLSALSRLEVPPPDATTPRHHSAVLVKWPRTWFQSVIFFSGQDPSPPRWSGIRKGATSEGKLRAKRDLCPRPRLSALAGARVGGRRARLLIPPLELACPHLNCAKISPANRDMPIALPHHLK